MSGSAAYRLRVSLWRRMMVIAALVFGSTMMAQAAEIIRTFNSTDVPRTIPAVGNPPGSQSGTTRSTLRVSGLAGAATNISVSIYAPHSYPSDLTVRLVPPNPLTGEAGTGVGIILVTNIVSTIVPNFEIPPDPALITSGDNRLGLNTGIGESNTELGRVFFADNLPVLNRANAAHVNNVYRRVYLLPGNTATVPTPVRGFRPQQLFATLIDDGLIGPAVNGIWTLVIIDDAYQDSGILSGWGMTVSEFGPHVWSGAGADTNWSTAGNWVNGNVPVTTEIASTIVFPDVNADGSLVVNRTANNDIGDINCSTVSVAGGYTLSGQKITLRPTGAITVVDGGNDIVNWGIGIDLAGAATITRPAGSTINLTGVIDDDAAAAGALTFAGIGTATMTAANDYTGATALNGGILGISNNLALGQATAVGTIVVSGATLRLDTALTIAEPLSLAGSGTAGQGALVATQNATTTGDITLVSFNTAFGVANLMTLTINAMATQPVGAYGFTAIGPGAVNLNDALPANTALTTNGSVVTLGGVVAHSASSLSLTGGSIIPTTALTVNGSITVAASATGSTLGAGTINLGGGSRSIIVGAGAAGVGGEINTTSSDLAIVSNITNGSFNKQGAGVLRVTGNNAGVGATVSGGTLAGAGNIGPINVANGILSPSGQFTVGGAVNLASGSALILPAIGSAINATGAVTLNGVAGIGGAVLQVYANAGPIIITGGSVSGTFDGKPNLAGITYNPTTVVLGASSGRTMAFTPAGPFFVNEEDGTLLVTVTASGAGPAPVLRVFGAIIEGRDVSLVGLAPAGTFVFTIPISNNFVDTGDLTGTLAIVPQDNSLVSNSATLTIRDNDKSDAKSCGFGTGLTVFLLFGFGLLLHVRLRRP